MANVNGIKTPNLRQEVKEQMGQDSIYHRSEGCHPANDVQQIKGKDCLRRV
jgi:hypothetical protein